MLVLPLPLAPSGPKRRELEVKFRRKRGTKDIIRVELKTVMKKKAAKMICFGDGAIVPVS
jgi:hypothetical protein